jgi:hypothetical protein
MSRKKNPPQTSATIVRGEILPTWEIDCSEWISGTPAEQWTRGPLRPVRAEGANAAEKKRPRKSRSKRK